METFKERIFNYIKKTFVSLLIAMLFVLTIPFPVTAASEKSVVTEVTVSTFINFTITDYGNAGLKFGSLIPGSTGNPEISQSVYGAVRLELGADSNVNCNISTKAYDFTSGDDKLLVKNVTWNISNNAGEATTMKNEYRQISTLSPGNTQEVYLWLNVPADQAPGVYSADFYYQAAGGTS